MKELAPCPFCGNINLELFRANRDYYWDDETFHEYYTIRCIKCDATGPTVNIVSANGEITEDEAYMKAAENWNKRVLY